MKLLPINCRPIGALHDSSISLMKDEFMLYRSASLDKTPDRLINLIHDLKIECHIDLRNSNEIDDTVHIENSLLHKQVFSLLDPDQLIRNSKIYDYKLYGKSYINLILHNSDTIISLLNYLIKSEYHRFIISCYAGKDRTGIISVIILLLFDMPDWLIHADYVMSTSYLLQHLAAFEQNWVKRGITPALYANRFKVDPRGLQYMFHYFEKSYGGIINFLKLNNLNDKDILHFNKKFKQHKSTLLPNFDV